VIGDIERVQAGSAGGTWSNEAALLTRLRTRDLGALEALVEREQHALFRFAYQLCNDRAAAEELVYAAFLALWRGQVQCTVGADTVRAALMLHIGVASSGQRRPSLECAQPRAVLSVTSSTSAGNW
jgi:hypothetical protein